MNSYCMKCKKKTPTANTKVVKTRNGRNREAGVCTACGSKKSRFVGKGLLGNLLGIGKIPILGDLF